MQIAIKISEESYKNIKEQVDKRDYPNMQIGRAIADGIPLPKGHGTLKDTDAICKDIISALGIRDENYLLEAEEAVYRRIKNAAPIIEADKEIEDGNVDCR